GFAAATPAGSDEELPDQRLDRAAILAASPAERRERLQDLLGQQLARVL
ncbi:MAG: hypothetical protein GTO03_00325, partial [Planctomycetales bacterium]|nr:hypothetical protein [Planctomycetales bacterium]